ncbi:hypothetical protein [Rheinheimera aquimaris]|uniref:hypothetical protein n=1 Tax=Rheinheimera aquimaris TaxID=412437 RepID=UPI001064F226|nr:hypothetical protein [Rheinheimera aquimaris]|tara:strand:- start:783 stop:1724 length:942 start_codon:yes stop_codon:yes gene_type:complete
MKTLYDIQRTNQIRMQAQQNQQREALAKALAANSHTLFVMNEAEFLELAVNIKRQQGMQQTEINAWMKQLALQNPALGQLWDRYNERVKLFMSTIPVTADAAALAVLAKDLSKSGNLLTKYQIKTYHGRTYVIVKGYPALRQHLTGTRYLASHPKVVSMGIGKMDAAKAIKGGFVLSFVLSVGFHAVDQLLNDQKTWHDFVGGVAADVIYAGAASAIALGFLSIIAGGSATLIVGPLLIVLAVGALATTLFLLIDEHVQLGRHISQMLSDAQNQIESDVMRAEMKSKRLKTQWNEDTLTFLHELFAVPKWSLQ